MEAARQYPKAEPHSSHSSHGIGRALGLGLITGAADDDPSAIGTYATAGAKLGPAFLWTAPVTFPMMVAVVYLSSKLGQVTGKGLFEVIREHYPPWLLRVALIGVVIGNTIEAGADIGGMAAAMDVLTRGVPLPPFVPLESVHESLRADRRIDASRALATLGVTLRYPTYREGMAPQ